jgi:acetolactate synthase-1/2/3 large subunit
MYLTAVITQEIKKYTNNLYIYPGGTIAPLLHEAKRENINLIVAKHEQGAGYMALAEASLYNRPSFVAVTSGPGATNIITVIADVYYDSIPLIIFTGQVGVADLQRNQQLRQRGFQEVPMINMVKSITKAVYQPHTAEEFTQNIYDAIKLANSGRKGPVLLDLPMSLQLQIIETLPVSKEQPNSETPKTSFDFQAIIEQINNASKPLILVGGGAQNDWEIIREFISQTKIPALSSLRGIGIIQEDFNCGWIGHTGLPYSNKIFYESDFILVLGSRLDVRQTGTQIDTFNSKTIIHVDIDDIELNHCRLANTIKVHMPIKEFIENMMDKLTSSTNTKWLETISNYKNTISLDDFVTKSATLTPKSVLEYISNLIGTKKALITTGVGAHQHWAARYIKFDNSHTRLFTSAGHGTMGYGLPTAIGLSNLEPDAITVCVDGDGSFQLNLQELALIKEFNLKTKILIFDNSRLGIVSQFQNITFKDDPTTGHIVNPDFVSIAKAYGIEAYYMDQFDTSILDSWFNSNEASLLHVKIDHDTPLSPMLLGGQNMDEMWYANEQ